MIPFALIAFACAAFLAFMDGDIWTVVGLVVLGVLAVGWKIVGRE